MNKSSGFTLLEVVMVAAITVITATLMIISFTRNRVYLSEELGVVLADIRLAQSRAVSSTQYQGLVRCGYGIHWVSPTSYIIYVAPDPQSAVPNSFCSALNRNYNSTGGTPTKDQVFLTKNLLSDDLEFKMPYFDDIFFEPPNPDVYINNNFDPANPPPPEIIIIGEIGKDCVTGQCKSICVYQSGKIETKLGDSC